MEEIRRVVIKPEWCMTCHTCEVACVTEHSKSRDPVKAYKKEGLSKTSRTKVYKNGALSFSLMCRQCEFPWCAFSCLSGALTVEGGKVAYNEDRCIGCFTCVAVCPFGGAKPAMNGKRKVIRCDLCGGNPACVRACPNRALLVE